MRHAVSALFVSALAAGLAPGAIATSHVSRCASSDGSTAYTDGSCRQLGARPAPMSPELLRRLVSEGAASGGLPTLDEAAPASVARGNPLAECARTPGQLAVALRASLADGDVNDLAAIYDWDGMGNRQAREVLRQLEHMSDRPLIDGQFFNASLGPAIGSDSRGDGIVQLVQGASSAPTVTELEVRRRAGCLLLAF